MSHMEPDISAKQRGWRVEVNHETWYVPGDVVPVPGFIKLGVPMPVDENEAGVPDVLAKRLRDYVGLGSISEIEAIEGYFGRWSAPGYLDCTEWQFDKTLRGIREALQD